MSVVGDSAFLQVAFDKLATHEFRGFVRRWKIDMDEVESLKETSDEIQALFDDAEVKQFTNLRVKKWLDRVKQLLYDAEDILDEFVTEVQRLKYESEYQTHPQQTQQVYIFTEELQGKVRKINERLKNVAQRGVALGLNPSMGSASSTPIVFSQRPPTSSLVNKSEVFGREEDTRNIIKWLLSDDKTPSPSKNGFNFSLMPIVAMGGAGKTTLAQLVYNHETVKNSNYFDLKAWVCISDDFDVVRLTKEILESATRSSSPPSNSLDLLQGKLKEVLSNKRFLIVLDDMWNDKYETWEALSKVFAFGKQGSKILVTTRNKSVSSMVRTAADDHDLKGLSDEASFDLVRKHAFTDDENLSDANTKMKVFGEEIVKKCKGSPLALKTLAGLLRNKSESSQWKDILENEIWEWRGSEILPSLMLSYHHLPPPLKRCLAYCALFPKDYRFSKVELVILWIAEGFVQQKGSKRLEDVAAEYFDELHMRSFFELSPDSWMRPFYFLGPFDFLRSVYKFFGTMYSYHNSSFRSFEKTFEEIRIRSFFESSSNTGSTFMMHDLIHDLAQFVSGGICCRIDYKQQFEVLPTTRHLSSYLEEDNQHVEVIESEDMKSVRTLLMTIEHPMQNHHKQFLQTMQIQFLRVLRIRGHGVTELPDSMGKLKHLRLLHLSLPYIESLPSSITSLYNLLVLILYGCSRLKELPEDMGNLINLRHLFLPLHLNKMPLGLGNLTSLQSLSTFIVGSENISGLRDLSQLRGNLHILNLKNLKNVSNNETEAKVKILENKPHLLGLALQWDKHAIKYYESNGVSPYLGRDEKEEEDVLDQLQPHTNLEALWIENYSGTRFPSWMESPSFNHLKAVCLCDCHKCNFLPHLSQLLFLESLVIEGCGATKMVGSELYVDGLSSTNMQFRSLKTLRIEKVYEWEEWPEVIDNEEEEGGGRFPCLRELSITSCPMLKMFSHRFPGLEELRIIDCPNLSVLPRLLPSLQQLRIHACPKLMALPSIPSVTSLTWGRWDLFTTVLSDSKNPPSPAGPAPPPLRIEIGFDLLASNLEHLRIEDCDSLPSESICNLKFLQSLGLTRCHKLKSLPEGLHKLTSLKTLEIESCDALERFPGTELPTTLQRLSILRCGKLTSVPKGLQKLTYLEELNLEECSFLMECKYLEPLHISGLHNLTSLRKLCIGGCPALVSIPKALLPTSLVEFRIQNCPILESLQDSLSDLPSLKRLVVHFCPALAQWCQKKEGEEWSKIARIHNLG